MAHSQTSKKRRASLQWTLHNVLNLISLREEENLSTMDKVAGFM